MKKLLTILLSVFMIATSLTVNIFADDEYDLKINGVKVTSTMLDENGVIDNDSIGNVISSGTVSYTPASGNDPAKLTLNNAIIAIASDVQKNVIETESNDLVIELIGSNTLSTENGNAILFSGNGTLIGNGSLSATSSDTGLFFKKDGTFRMNGSVTIKSKKYYGICCRGSIYLTNGAGKVIAYGGNGTGAIAIDGYGSVVGCESIMGSTELDAAVEDVTSPATIAGDPDWKESKIVSSGEIAKTIVLTAFPPDYLWFSATGGDVTLGMAIGIDAPDISLEYSADCQEWESFVENITVTPVVITAGTKIYIRNKASADKIADSVDTEYRRFTMSSESANASVSVGGSIMSLLDKSASNTEFVGLEKSEYAFYQLFGECALLTDASKLNLPAGQTKALPENCYEGMFVDCTGLKAAPALPATKLGGYCYKNMFENCVSLETAPALPATELKEYCYYNMFLWCEALNNAPALPATELAEWCYFDMFNGCKKLVTAPELPATTLVKGCYCEMFYGCEKLNYIKAGFTAWNDENIATNDWVYGVAPSGNFVCPETLDNSGHIDSIHGVPIGWTKFTVTFDMQGHGTQIDPISNAISNNTIDAPTPAPTAEGFSFGGWYKDAACTQAWNFDKDTVTKDITLYAKWIPNGVDSATISGNVTEQGAGNVPNATVELYLGTVKVVATTTNASGQYSFNKVEKGTYNIVVTKTDGKTKTELVTIDTTGTKTINVVLPASSVNSKVEHTGEKVANTKSDIKQAVVGGLDKIAEEQTPSGSDKITIKLKVEPKKEEDVDNARATEIKQKAGNGKKVEFIDMSLFRQVNNSPEESIGNDNNKLLTIIIPFDFTNTNIDSVMILRKHGTDNAEILPKDPAPGNEGYVINREAGTITVYAMKFSDYAIAYTNTGSNPPYNPTHRYTVPNTGIK
ncbi:MAG: InlB B-repeat-containing protein [Erysipelotrichaceae bacterium]|nr:InlB B-repeat-containing protein [Erysipelotrichaceae bacterium]